VIVKPEQLAVTAPDLPFISGQALRELVPMGDAIEASRRGFLAASKGELRVPLRSSLCDGRILIMPAEHFSGSGVIKIIGTASGSEFGPLPGIDGAVLWIDGGGGRVGALLDVKALTALRTGAASGLATQIMAREDAALLAMIGSGVQAMDQIAAVCAVRPITEIRIQSRRSDNGRTLREQVLAALPEVCCRVVDTTAEAISGADVICTATRSTEPLFGATEVGATVHVNAIGAYRPEMCELPPRLFANATTVVVDEVAAALAEAGDIIRALAEGALDQDDLVEMGALISSPGRGCGGVTVFKSVGIAAQDWSMAELAVQRARECGLVPS